MSAPFDPYHVWLGIPPRDQPPDYYRLLGVSALESDLDIIEKAADRQTIYLRQFLTSDHAEDAQRLLQEITAAKVTLLNPQNKAAYDAQFRAGSPDIDSSGGYGRRSRGLVAPVHWVVDAVRYLWTHPTTTAGLAAVLTLTFAGVLVYLAVQPPQRVAVDEPATPTQTDTVATRPQGGNQSDPPASEPAQPAGTDDQNGASQPSGGEDSDQSPSASGHDDGTEPGEGNGESNSASSPSDPFSAPVAPDAVTLGLQSEDDFDRPGMIGRMSIDGEDTGLILRYEPGESFNAEVVNQCLRQYGLPSDSPVRLQLQGVVRVSRTVSGVLDLVGDSSSDAIAAAYLDGRKIAEVGKDRSSATAPRVVFTQGDHLLQWTIAGTDFGRQQRLQIRATDPVATELPADGPGMATPDPGETDEGSGPASSGPVRIVYNDALLDLMNRQVTIARVQLGDTLETLTAQSLADGTRPEPSTEPSPSLVAEAGERAPIPPADRLKEAQEDVQDVYADEYRDARNSAEGRRLLARTLLKQARATADDPAARYVLCDEARQYALEAEDAELAIEAVEELAAHYRVELWDQYAETLATLAKDAKTPLGRDGVLRLVDRLIETALDEDRYEEIPRLVEAGSTAAVKQRDPALRDYLQAKAEEAERIAAVFRDAQPALETLQEDPDDAQANTVAGSFYCFAKGDWKRGLPMLAKSDKATLKTVAETDLSRPTSAGQQARLADDWWAVADSLDERLKKGAQRRAGYWYLQAMDDLQGEQREQARQRAIESGRLVDLLAVAIQRRAVFLGNWGRVGGLVSSPEPAPRVQFNVFPPESYRLEVVAELVASAGRDRDRDKLIGRDGFIAGLVARDRWFVAVLDWGLGARGHASFLGLYDGKGPDQSNPTYAGRRVLRSNRENYLVYEVSPDAVIVQVNGVPVINYTDSTRHLTMPQEWAVPGQRRLFLGTRFASYRITRADLIDTTD